MIVGIASVKNESAIVAKTVTHMLGVGADHVIVSDGHSTDGTKAILESLDRVTVCDQDGPFDQPAETMRLASLAWEMGATWVVPFDADEFWVGLTALHEIPGDVGKVYATVYGHRTWKMRHLDPRGLSKVCFRTAAAVSWGNHEADSPGHAVDGFEIRELQFQSFDHYLAKVTKSAELYESYDFPVMHGSHMRARVAMSDEEREADWCRLMAIPCVHDPIPYRGAP